MEMTKSEIPMSNEEVGKVYNSALAYLLLASSRTKRLKAVCQL